MPPQLEGRAFSRLQQYNALSSDLQTQVEALETHIVAKQTDIFGPHHANLITRVRSVRAKPLLEHIVAYLKAQDTPEPAPVEAPPAPTEEASAPTEEATAPAPEVTAPAEEAPAPGATDATPAPAPVEATTDTAAPPPAPAQPVDKYLPQAKTLLEALVLHGFITPNKEQEKLPSATNTPGSLVFKDSELFVPLAASLVPDLPPLSTVWQLVDGAVFAGFAKRKAGFLAPLTQGKDTYIVANETHKSLTLFDTDVGRVPVAHFEAAGTHVAFDKSHFVHGIKVWNENTTELLNAANKLEREALVHTLVSKLGFTYKEEVTLDLAKITSIYDLKDVDIDGNEVAFDTYKGKVLLIVNVSSQCGLTPTNYPELAQLHAKYRDQGLEILAFPSNQFGGQEPGTHDEIKAFVAQYNAEFPFFAKGDVNGPDTRAVFAYLKTKLGLEEHAYVKWNFTKFLVDRNGRPVKRFSPMELPLSFESEIVTLLFTEPEVETKAEVVETTETTTTTETAAPTETVETKTETVVTTTETPATTTTTETVVTTTETPVATTNTTETKTIETVVNKVTTLSVEEHPVQEAAAPAAGEEPQTKVEHLQAEHVQGFTPGNAP